jgi:outer membrane murein-binding lipoprotein Lpp
MKFTTASVILCCALLSGCNVSPLSPVNRQRINGNTGEIKNNQNGLMAEVANLKSRLDVIARDVENLQNGLINSNNKNYGVQIFQGDGGLAIGLGIIAMLSAAAVVYKVKSDNYKKTAEIFVDQIKKIEDPEMEDRIFSEALKKNVEKSVYKMLSR